MSPKMLLRIIIIAQWLMIFITVTAVFMTDQYLPTELKTYLATQDEMPLTATDWVFLITFGLSVISSIGMFFFWRLARDIYLVSSVSLILLVPHLGPTVESGIVTMFDGLDMLLCGVVISLAYFSEIKNEFNSSHN